MLPMMLNLSFSTFLPSKYDNLLMGCQLPLSPKGFFFSFILGKVILVPASAPRKVDLGPGEWYFISMVFLSVFWPILISCKRETETPPPTWWLYRLAAKVSTLDAKLKSLGSVLCCSPPRCLSDRATPLPKLPITGYTLDVDYRLAIIDLMAPALRVGLDGLCLRDATGGCWNTTVHFLSLLKPSLCRDMFC